MLFRRLLSLDVVIERPDLPWLATEAETVAHFEELGIQRATLPQRVYSGAVGGLGGGVAGHGGAERIGRDRSANGGGVRRERPRGGGSGVSLVIERCCGGDGGRVGSGDGGRHGSGDDHGECGQADRGRRRSPSST